MGKIKNKNKYPIKESPHVNDYVVGSDSEADGMTVNFKVNAIRNNIERTSQIINDGEDGINPFLSYADLYLDNVILRGGYYHVEGYNYFVWSDKYIINGELYTDYISNTVNIEEADPTYDRIDLIVINEVGTITVVKGIASANPLKPQIDNITQVEVALIIVKANTIAPEVVEELIYDESLGEPAEWDIIEKSTSVNDVDVSGASKGSKCISWTSPLVDNKIKFQNDSLIDITTDLVLLFDIKFDNPTIVQPFIRFAVSNGSSATPITIGASHGIDINNSVDWQTGLIKLGGSYFAQQNNFDIVIFATAAASSNFRIDNIRLQSGVDQPVDEGHVKRTSEIINDGADGTSTYVEDKELATVAKSGSYSDLTDTPTKTSDFINDGADGTSTYVELDELEALLPTIPQDTDTALYSGDAIWQTGLNYFVWVDNFKIDGVRVTTYYSASKTLSTLDLTNPTWSRIDIFAVEFDGVDTYSIVVIEGTPAEVPAAPTLDASTQLEISRATVLAGATTPENVSEDIVYAEGDVSEWARSLGHASIQQLSTSSPITELYSILHTNTPQDAELRFTKAGEVFTTSEKVLTFDINLQTAWEWRNSNRTTIDIYLVNNGSIFTGRLRVGSDLGFGFDGNIINQVQTVSIRLDRFPNIYNSNVFDAIHFKYKRTQDDIFRIDNIRVVETGSYNTPTNVPTKTSQLVNDGADGTSAYVEHDEIDADLVRLADTSGTNTGDQDLSGYEVISNKSQDIEADKASTTKYSSVKQIYDWAVSKFQAILVSGTTIKTLNGESLLGSGDIEIVSSGTAALTTVDTTNFDKNLSVADDTVQKALETLDELVGGLAGSVKEFDFVAETVCVVNHNYNVQYPRITCIDANDEEFIPWKIDYVSLTQTIITFTEATTCKIVTDTGATATVQPNTIGNEELTAGLSERETMATDVIDWSSAVAKIKTIAGATVFTDSNMPQGNKTHVIELHMSGDFTITFPAYWVWKGGVYDGTVSNMIVASCLNGNVGSEVVNYTIIPNA